MSLSIIKVLIFGSVILNLRIILGIRKFNENEEKVKISSYKRELFILIRNVYLKEIIIISLGVTLLFISVFIKESLNELAIIIFEILCSFYIFISVVVGSYNYKKFNRDTADLLNKTNK